jgi:hypothetical protein
MQYIFEMLLNTKLTQVNKVFPGDLFATDSQIISFANKSDSPKANTNL